MTLFPLFSAVASPLSKKCFITVSLLFAMAVPVLRSETVVDLKQWSVQGAVQMDPEKPSPGGAPSIKIDPKGYAILKLGSEDRSGKLTLSVYDDGSIASPDKKKSVGPRWGFAGATGRVFVAGIMYARYLQPEGSLCLIDADPAQKGAWAALKFLSARGKPGWKKWEFEYDPDKGLKISVDGKAVDQRHFDWNTSQATGFNGLVLYGDDTGEGTPQTIWVGDVTYQVGPPMKVKPNPAAAASAAAPAAAVAQATPVSEAELAQLDKGEPAHMDGFVPGPTLADDLKNMRVPVLADYASKHPRLLFSAGDRALLQKRAKDRPDLWDAVMANAKSVKSPGGVPTPDVIRTGAKYWLAERMESGALAWFVTGDPAYRDGVKQWMLAHVKEPVWGTLYRPNTDLVASWDLYYTAVAYDILWNELSADERKVIREGLTLHARAIYADHDPANTKEKIRYDQNHTYIPVVALTAASLALLDEVPEARAWLKRSYAVLRRCRYVLGEDGYYHEGFGYWTYALHWHVRGAELLERATGEKLFQLPTLRDTWMHALYLSLPASPGAFDIGDTVGWKNADQRPDVTVNNHSMLWAVAAATGSKESQAAGDLYATRQPERDYASSAFLWFHSDVKPAALDSIKPYVYFPDHDIVSWRSSWKEDATCYLFRCGPPLGHRAAEKIPQLKDWTMNCGHVHPDIGAFWMYAKGAYMAVGTGYTTQKWTRDHNTLLVDGKGQGEDGAYWNERGVPYKDFDHARIDREFLCDQYGFASGEFGSAYTRQVPGVKLKRSLLMTQRWLLIVDDMEGEKPHELTWLCHADAPFQPEGKAFIAHLPKASLAVVPLAPAGLESKVGPTVVSAGRAPGQGVPQQRGSQLSLTLSAPAQTARIINILVPLAADEKPPVVQLTKQEGSQVALEIQWPAGKTEKVQLNLEAKGDTGPAVIRTE